MLAVPLDDAGVVLVVEVEVGVICILSCEGVESSTFCFLVAWSEEALLVVAVEETLSATAGCDEPLSGCVPLLLSALFDRLLGGISDKLNQIHKCCNKLRERQTDLFFFSLTSEKKNWRCSGGKSRYNTIILK